MSEKKGWFEQLYRISSEAKAVVDRPLILRKVRRQFEAAIDSLEALKIKEEERVASARESIANGKGDDGTFRILAEANLKLADLESQIELLSRERKLAFGE